MAKVIDDLLTKLAGLLGPLSPFTKAVIPAVLGVSLVVANGVFAGSLDSVELATALSALVLAVVTYFVPNVQS